MRHVVSTITAVAGLALASTAMADTTVTGASPTINFDDDGTTDTEFEITGDTNGFQIFDPVNAQFVLDYDTSAQTVELATGKIHVDTQAERIGFFDQSPDATMDLSHDNAKFLIDNTNGTTAARQLYTLENNGPIGFGMINRNTTDEWRFAAQTTGFRVSLGGSGGPEFEVEKDGSLRAGGGSSFVMNLDGGTGNMSIDGTLTEGSSRAFKENIEGISEREVLAKLDELPLSEWQYKNDESRHIGPMAEDFHATYGLGPDNKHIAPKDLAGVAMASAKALKDELEQKNRKIQNLESRLARIEGMLENQSK